MNSTARPRRLVDLETRLPLAAAQRIELFTIDGALASLIRLLQIIGSGGKATLKAEARDKVRVKDGSHAGERGLIEAVEGEKLAVRLEQSGLKVRVLPDQVTNYSLAARKA